MSLTAQRPAKPPCPHTAGSSVPDGLPRPGAPPETLLERRDGPVAAIVVAYESVAVIGRCLESLRVAAPGRGVDIRVVDNASTDGSADLAESLLGASRVIRMSSNRGFAAGVNAGLGAVDAPWVAVVNPDALVPRGGLDRLADVLERHPRAGLAAPRVVGADGRPERSVGLFPTPGREWAHSWLLDHLGWPGRWARLPGSIASVDWVSGCAWLLRAEASRAVGPLDEGYFMYCEDVDYCRRLHDAGWSVLAVPEAEWVHDVGTGSRETGRIPADGGTALLRYFAKFHPGVPEQRVRALLLRGWKLRRVWRKARAGLGDAGSAAVARRYEIAIEMLGRP
jgi:N-acetylglucosaminyl-diphospho-decaprenol L-rhamnosyltransferase